MLIIPNASGGLTRTKFTYVKVPMNANRIQKPMPKAARKAGLPADVIVELTVSHPADRGGRPVRVACLTVPGS